MKLRHGRLALHIGEQAVLQKLAVLRVAGKTYGQLVAWLKANAIRTKNGGQWDRPTVYKILKSHAKVTDETPERT